MLRALIFLIGGLASLSPSQTRLPESAGAPRRAAAGGSMFAIQPRAFDRLREESPPTVKGLQCLSVGAHCKPGVAFV